MINYLEYLNMPERVGVIIIGGFLLAQIIGELLELKGKVVPEFFKIRKFFNRRKSEKEEVAKTLKEVRTLLADVNAHYSEDNISKRDNWMSWVNSRATLYDDSIVEISKNLENVTVALQDNTKLTEEMFIQTSRDRIIDFANRVGDEDTLVSREEFHRIFKVYDRYEAFLEERKLTNGEIDIVYRIIKEAYEIRVKHHSFIEDARGYGFME